MRYKLPILGLLAIVGGLIGIKWAQVSAMLAAGESAERAGPPPESVSTDKSRELEWENALTAVGSIAAARGVAVSNDLPGVVTRILFESGQTVAQGTALVELDARVERAQLRTAIVERRLAEQNLERTRTLAARGGVPMSQLDADQARLDSATAQVAGLKAQISRKVVRTPFAGRLGIRAVNLGQYLSAGTPITTLESLDLVFVDFALPQHALPMVHPGLAVRVSLGEKAKVLIDGTIDAIDPRVDQTTRTIQVRASVPNQDKKLRPGMFATVSVLLPGQARATAVPATAVVHAPYGDSVFAVVPLEKDDARLEQPGAPRVRRVRQQFVQLGEARGDYVAVLKGLTPGQEVVTSGGFKLQNGERVVVNNSVKPTPNLNPQPENR